MRIMPIMNNPISYKGTLIFNNGVVTTSVDSECPMFCKAKYASLETEDIASISSAEDYKSLTKTDSTCNGEEINMQGYKTLIKTKYGDCFFVKPAPEMITAAKHDSDNKIACHIFDGAKHVERTSELELEKEMK